MEDRHYRFGPFEFDRRSRTLTRGGEPVALGHRPLIFLEKLLEAEGRVVSKSELFEAAWPDTVLEESNLTVQMSNLRKALGAADHGNDWIVTVPRLGYRLSMAKSDAVSPMREAKPADMPSIAVLPFVNLGQDAEQQYFADGLAEDLITDLSKVPGLMVIARHSSFLFRNGETGLKDIARRLGVQYIIEGSVRRSADRIRITAQVVDAASEVPIWAERFERRIADIFELQDDIAGRIIAALTTSLPAGWVGERKRANSIEAYDLFLKGRSLVTLDPDRNVAGRALLQRAIALEPGFADAYAWLAASHHFPWAYWSKSIAEHRPQARQAAELAVRLDPPNAVGHAILGDILIYDLDPVQGSMELATAVRLDPNYADAWTYLSDLHVLEGRPAEGMACVRKALRLNPNPPGFYYWFLGFAAYAAQDYGEAISALQREDSAHLPAQRILAASLAQAGRLDEARAVARHFLSIYPDFSIRHWAGTQPFRREADRQHFIDGYRLAGLPF